MYQIEIQVLSEDGTEHATFFTWAKTIEDIFKLKDFYESKSSWVEWNLKVGWIKICNT